MVASESARYSYLVDGEDRLAWVSPDWVGFARENGATQLTSNAVVGRSLWLYIADERTRQLYQVLMDRIRQQQSKVVLPFRCDSPNLRRYMRLSIEAREDRRLMFEGSVVKIEPRLYAGVLDATSRRSCQMLTMCSICQRALVEPAGWIDLEAAIAKLNLLEQDTFPYVRYTVCKTCEHATVALCCKT